jgi:hypothetical protein
VRSLTRIAHGSGRISRDQEIPGGLVAAGHHLAGADAETDRQASTEQLVGTDAIAHRECGGNCAVRVVTMRSGQAEDSHDRVADEFFDRAAVLRDGLTGDGVIARQQPAHLLRIELFAELGGPGHVGEKHGDNAAFLGGDGHGNASLPTHSCGMRDRLSLAWHPHAVNQQQRDPEDE